jgi:prephenate dehydrogenase
VADRPVVGVVGLGHIGGSLALAWRASCVAWSRSAETRAAASAAGVDVLGSLAEVVGAADIVVLAPALPALPEVLDEVAAAAAELPRSPTVTDVGSVKVPIAARATRAFADPGAFVPGHPLAGTEMSGWASAVAGLFTGTTWALSVDEPVDLARWIDVARALCGLGVEVVPTTNEEHDRTLALTSHLPYVLAGLFAARMGPLEAALSGGSLAGLTRVVSTPDGARFGAELAAANHDAVAAEIDALVGALGQVGDRLQGEDPSGVAALLASVPPVVLGPLVTVDRPDRAGLAELGRTGGRIVDVEAGGRLVVRRLEAPG